MPPRAQRLKLALDGALCERHAIRTMLGNLFLNLPTVSGQEGKKLKASQQQILNTIVLYSSHHHQSTWSPVHK